LRSLTIASNLLSNRNYSTDTTRNVSIKQKTFWDSQFNKLSRQQKIRNTPTALSMKTEDSTTAIWTGPLFNQHLNAGALRCVTGNCNI